MVSFEFKHFRPTSDLALYANAKLLSMIDYIPEGFIECATMTKVKDKYCCSLTVKGREKIFIQDNSSHDPRSAVDKADEGLKEQMLSWQQDHLAVDEPTFWAFKEVDADSINQKTH